MADLKKLFEPINLGTANIPNRAVMPAMTTRFASEDGSVSDRIKDYYEARARGGTGLIIVEMACVTKDNRGMDNQLALWDDSFVPGFKSLAASLHAQGSRTFLQLQHAGRETYLKYPGQEAVSASDLKGSKSVPRPLTVSEIRSLVQDFAAAAVRAREAGFDGVEFHGAHIYLVQQFLSPFANKRTDEYGGTLEKRARFALEILRESRRRLGKDYPIQFRINGDDFVKGGTTLEDAVRVSLMLQEAGVTSLNISGGTVGTGKMVAPSSEPHGFLVYLAAAVKKAVRVPVITVGRITDPRLADQVLSEGRADLVAMGRALIADPDLVFKARDGRFGEIRYCISCGNCSGAKGTGVTCCVNPAAGREGQSTIVPAKKAKKVVVIGGGPAGMQAAYIAAARGHAVTLYDRGGTLGGQMHLAAMPPYKEELASFTSFLASQVKKHGVEVKSGQEVDAAEVRKSGAQAVVVATGSRPRLLDVPGSDGKNVLEARAVVSGRADVKGQKVIVVGGGLVGCETALLLSKQGKKVAIVEMLPELAADVESTGERATLLGWLRQAAISAQTNGKVVEITSKGVLVADNGGKRLIDADSVVLAVGAIPNDELAKELKGEAAEVIVVGDAAGGGTILNAVRQAFDVARAL